MLQAIEGEEDLGSRGNHIRAMIANLERLIGQLRHEPAQLAGTANLFAVDRQLLDKSINALIQNLEIFIAMARRYID